MSRPVRKKFPRCKCTPIDDPQNPGTFQKWLLTDPVAGIYGKFAGIVRAEECADCNPNLLDLTTDLVATYIRNNATAVNDLPGLIADTHDALTSLVAQPSMIGTDADKMSAVRVRKSITPDALISFIDGKPYKTLKRHLSKHGLDIHSYRTRFGLPENYPSVCANYSAARSSISKKLGFGKKQGGSS